MTDKKSGSRSKSSKAEAKTSAKKTAELEKKLKQVKQDKEAIQDQLLRTLAEMDNMKKRLDKERIQWTDTANAELLRAILPVADDLERSLKTTQDGSEFRQGIEMIYQKLIRVLEDKGVTAMISVGTPFDVDKHDALMQMEKKGVKPGMVIEEHEKGYVLHGRVLRHAKVLVSK